MYDLLQCGQSDNSTKFKQHVHSNGDMAHQGVSILTECDKAGGLHTCCYCCKYNLVDSLHVTPLIYNSIQ